MRANRRTLFGVISAWLVLPLTLTLTLLVSQGHAAIPQKISYQGYLTNAAGVPVNGTVQVVFSIYNVSSGGTALWGETQNVTVTHGVYNVNLGEVTPVSLPFDVQYYLGIKIGSDPEMTPRKVLTSVGYAFRALTVDTVGSHTHSGADVTSGAIAESRIDPAITRDSEVMTIVQANDGSGSGLDADLLDGLHANAFASSGHNHDATYVNEGQANSITSGMIVDGAVSPAKISSTGASSGQVLKYNGSAVTWANDEGGSLTLPFSGTANISGSAFTITQDGTGNAINGESNGAIGIRGESNATNGAGVAGYDYATGGTGVFGQGAAKGIYGYTTQANAHGVYGESTGAGGIGVYGQGPAWGGYFSGNLYTSGNVGIGTTNPYRKLHLVGSGPRILIETNDGFNPEVNFASSGSPNWAIYKHTVTGDLRFYQNGDQVTIKKDTGRVQVKVLEIVGGADLSEKFEINAKESLPEPGMVVNIDPENPGKLTVSNKPYDRRVAGIISGAGGLKTGMLMGQEGSTADGSNPVALTGRVYCWADASKHPIEPGDLLTTSETPGHAMKVGDYTRAQGAVIGKAMTGLNEGRGLIMVLVSLQ